jgi:hypothetical protein
MNWIDFPDERIEVCGLPFFAENTPDLYRLPKRAKGVVRDAVWNLATHCSGGRLRIATDATDLTLRLDFPDASTMRNMCAFGQRAVDVVVDGQSWNIICPNGKEEDNEFVVFKDVPAKLRQISLYLPLYAGLSVESVGANAEARIETPAPFAVDKPVVYYGSSITQGGCSSRPGLSYQAILHRRLNADFVNLGFSGNGKGEPEVAELVAEIDASCYVMDFAQNLKTVEGLDEVYQPFLEILRAKRPSVPIICVTPIHSDWEYASQAARDKLEGQREVIRTAVGARKQQGDENITFVEGHSLISPNDTFSFVDGTHPNDLGFMNMADGLEAPLREVLRLSG